MSESLYLPFFQARLAHARLRGAIKALTKDSELLKSDKATHSMEVKNFKGEMTKLSTSITNERESAIKLAKELKSAREVALKEYKESKAFHEEAMTHADQHTRDVDDKWVADPIWKQFLLDLGEMDYGTGYQDIQMEIYRLLKAKDSKFLPTR